MFRICFRVLRCPTGYNLSNGRSGIADQIINLLLDLLSKQNVVYNICLVDWKP